MQEHNAISSLSLRSIAETANLISENARAVRDASGQLLGYEGMEDITERKQVEEALAKRNATWRRWLRLSASC